MRFAATLTATGVLGYFLLEVLKILLAPVSIWLIGVLGAAMALLLKVALIGISVVGFLAAAITVVYLYRRAERKRA